MEFLEARQSAQDVFPWVFFGYLLAFGVVTIVFLFYFNRTLAFIISVLARTYTWHYYQAHISIDAIQISPLAGRIFVKGVRYHGQNETISIGSGYVTWKYWLRHVRHVSLGQDSSLSDGESRVEAPPQTLPEGSDHGQTSSTPNARRTSPRITVNIRGLEWFVYNRSPAFDAVLAAVMGDPDSSLSRESLTRPSSSRKRLSKANLQKRVSTSSDGKTSPVSDKFDEKGEKDLDPSPLSRQSTFLEEEISSELPAFLKLFPIGVDCKKAAMVMGNDHTRSILVAKCSYASGMIDGRSSGPHDLYKQTFDFRLEHFTVNFRMNENFRESLLSAGAGVQKSRTNAERKHPSTRRHLFETPRRATLHTIQRLIPQLRRSAESLLEDRNSKETDRTQHIHESQSRWLGLSRYLDDEDDDLVEQERWKSIEYAQVSTIVDCPKLFMSFFWDVPGPVMRSNFGEPYDSSPHTVNNINGISPPVWGLSINVGGGLINYGPWADRQRADLQAAFFPPSFANSSPALPLQPGKPRQSTQFNINIILDDLVVLRLHTREESKDWRWKERMSRPPRTEIDSGKKSTRSKRHEKANSDSQVRPAGWLDLIVSRNSSVSYDMDMVASSSGFSNTLKLDVPSAQLLTGVNHGLMLRSNSINLDCDLSYPLGWNALRAWGFNVMCDDLELFILRDHAFLITDLINDWTTGPPTDFLAFVPFLYKFALEFRSFKVYLNTNDANIIDSPASLEENAFLILGGSILQANLAVPQTNFQPRKNEIIFDANIKNLYMDLHTPAWNSLSTLLKQKRLASLDSLLASGIYDYFASTSPSQTDTLILDLQGSCPTFLVYGYLIRYFMNFRENYFGEDMHFQTLEEYQHKIVTKGAERGTRIETNHSKLSNDLDVILTIKVDEVCIVLPSRLYSAQEHVRADISSVGMDLRFTNYYMDIEVSSSPLALTSGVMDSTEFVPEVSESNTQIFIDGLLFSGHRLFGLPPTEPTYVCNWDFDLDEIRGECSSEFLSLLVSAARSIAFQFDDFENALSRANSSKIHDITFLRARVESIKLWLHVKNLAMLLEMNEINLQFNDWAGRRFSERLVADILLITTAIVDSESASRQRGKQGARVTTYSVLETSMSFRMLESKADFQKERMLQQQHLTMHDSRTHRVPWLLLPSNQGVSTNLRELRIPPRPPALPFPSMPEPLTISREQEEQKWSLRQDVSCNERSPSRRRSLSLSEGSSPCSDKSSLLHIKPTLVLQHGKHAEDYPNNTSQRPVRMASRNSQGQAPSSVAFSSPFDAPYFPLHYVRPDVQNLPDLGPRKSSNEDLPEFIDDHSFPIPDDDTTRLSLIITMNSGVRAFATPEAVSGINDLIQSLQATDPEYILDDIQMSTIPGLAKSVKTSSTRTCTQVRLEVPAMAFRLVTEVEDGKHAFNRQIYGLTVSQLQLAHRTSVEDEDASKQPISTHLFVDSIHAVARGLREETSSDEARVELNLRSTAVWLSQETEISGHMQSKHIEVVSLNRRIENFIIFLENAMVVSSQFTRLFQTTFSTYLRRRQMIVYDLTVSHLGIADPIFLSSASYIFRATSKHIRTSDTWKMISRLRFIHQSLSGAEGERLRQRCKQIDEHSSPQQEIDHVVSYFTQWRLEDPNSVRVSPFMQDVYQTKPDTTPDRFSMSKIQIEFELDAFHLIIDPGPEQNQMQIQRFATTILSELEPNTNDSSRADRKRRSRIGLFCLQTVVRLNWEIFELVEGTIRHLTKAKSRDNSTQRVPSSDSPKSSSLGFSHDLQIVLALDTVDLGFKAINLHFTTLSQSLKASALLISTSLQHTCLNIFLNAELIATQISTGLKPLLTTRLLHPSLHGSLEVEASQKRLSRFWSAGGFCKQLDLENREDILGLLGVGDALLRDEGTNIRNLLSLITSDQKNEQPEVIDHDIATQNRYHVAFLLEEYSVSTVLLSSLWYVMRGKVARSNTRSLASFQTEMKIDFDLKEHVHTFENRAVEKTQEISSLLLPPVNGRVIFGKNDDQLTASISIALGKFSLDASAVHALFTTFTRQEVSDFKKNVFRDLATVKSNYQSLLSKDVKIESQISSASNTTIAYKASFAAEGLEVTAHTGKLSRQAARLVFRLGQIYSHIQNWESQPSSVMPWPHIRADVTTIKVLLERWDGRRGQSCGDVTLGIVFTGTAKHNEDQRLTHSYEVSVSGPEINLYAETAATIVDIIGYLQQRFESFSLSEEIHTLRARRQRSKSHANLNHTLHNGNVLDSHDADDVLFSSMYSLEMSYIQISWRVGDLVPISPGHSVEDLVFSIDQLQLATKKANTARLVMGNLQLQMVPTSQSTRIRSRNSALMPEVLFNVAYLHSSQDRKFAFQAVGKSVDLRLSPNFVLPASDLQRSIGHATEDLRRVIADWNTSFIQDEKESKKILGSKKLSSVLVDADFAGAVVHFQGIDDLRSPTTPYSAQSLGQVFDNPDQYVHVQGISTISAVLRTPGIAFKVEYQSLESHTPSLNAEIRIDASSNTLQPSIVPLIRTLTSSVQEIVQQKQPTSQNLVSKIDPTKEAASNLVYSTDPVAILGDCKLNLGLRICKQRFGLTCQPLAKVAAAAQFDDIYITVNTVQAIDQNRFFALSARIVGLQASVQHTYSQEATGSFVAEFIELSLMNSKHVSNLQGISAILNLGPMKFLVNARQIHDFFIFREIWLPTEGQPVETQSPVTTNSNPIIMQRYQQVAAASPFPWNAAVAISKLDIELDLSQSLGKSKFQISKLWASSRKISNWEQNLCLGFEGISVESSGRLSCSVGLQNMRLRTSIKWQETSEAANHTPLIQASIGFEDLKVKAAFEYQSFLTANFSSLSFLMYNVRDKASKNGDRLVCIVEGEKVQAYLTALSSSQVVAIYQTAHRLLQEKKQTIENSLKEIYRWYRIRMKDSTLPEHKAMPDMTISRKEDDRAPLQLQTNVVVTLKSINIGAYPRSFADSTVFKLDALDASARFSVVLKAQTIQSSLGMSLGQVRVSLSNVSHPAGQAAFDEVSVDDIIKFSTASRGGTILKVPRVVATMQTWQHFGSTLVEYVFRSSFEGKVEVGWNINRINFIRSMWNTHSQALASRLGKALPQSAVQITGVPTVEESKSGQSKDKKDKEKITAVVNVPLSKYSYTAREPPVIDTPQLRDMGEATPPLEWIGLHRDRLPNITHQIIIVPLLEVAKEVEDAYGRILGAS